MDFLKIVNARHSVRGFRQDDVEDNKISYLLECARLAPSAVNRQPWHFLVVRSDRAKDALRKCYQRDWFYTAPLYIVVCANVSEAWIRPEDGKNHSDIDAAIAAEHVCLAAASIGLGTCWVCRFDPVMVSEELDIPADHVPVALIPVGYPADDSQKEFQRKTLSEITTQI